MMKKNTISLFLLMYEFGVLLIFDRLFVSMFVVASVQKKLPLTTLAQCMVEGAAVLGDESLLG